MPTSGSPIGSSPRATRASVSRAMSASLHWRSVSSICGSRVWSASAASLRAHSLSSGGILEWSGSMEFSPDAAISARIRTTIESIISAAGSLPGVLRDCAFKMSSCGLFRTAFEVGWGYIDPVHNCMRCGRRTHPSPAILLRSFLDREFANAKRACGDYARIVLDCDVSVFSVFVAINPESAAFFRGRIEALEV